METSPAHNPRRTDSEKWEDAINNAYSAMQSGDALSAHSFALASESTATSAFFRGDYRWYRTLDILADSALALGRTTQALEYAQRAISLSLAEKHSEQEIDFREKANQIFLKDLEWKLGAENCTALASLIEASSRYDAIDKANIRFHRALFLSDGFRENLSDAYQEFGHAFRYLSNSPDEKTEKFLHMVIGIAELFDQAQRPEERLTLFSFALTKLNTAATVTVPADLYFIMHIKYLDALNDCGRFSEAVDHAEKLLGSQPIGNTVIQLAPGAAHVIESKKALSLLGLGKTNTALDGLEIARQDLPTENLSHELYELNSSLSLASLYHAEGFYRRSSELLGTIAERLQKVSGNFIGLNHAIEVDAQDLEESLRNFLKTSSKEEAGVVCKILDLYSLLYRFQSWDESSKNNMEQFKILSVRMQSILNLKGVTSDDYYNAAMSTVSTLMEDERYDEVKEILESIPDFEAAHFKKIPPSQQAQIHKFRAVLCAKENDFEGANREMTNASELNKKTNSPFKCFLSAQVEFLFGQIKCLEGEFLTAKSHFELAAQIMEKGGRERHPKMISILERLRDCFESLHDFEAAQALSERIQSLRDHNVHQNGSEYDRG